MLDDTVKVREQRGDLRRRAAQGPRRHRVLRGDGEGMSAVALSPDEVTLAAGDPTGNVFIFDTATRRRVATIKPGNSYSWIVALAYSPDGSRLAIAHDADRGNVVSVFDSERRRVVAKMMPPPNRFIVALRYSADGTTLDTIAAPHDPDSGPSLLTRFDTRSGRRVFGPKPINRSTSSPLLGAGDAAQVVTAGKNEVTVRDAVTLRTSKRFAVPGAGSASPDAYALSPDGHTLAIGDDDGAVRFLDIRSGVSRVASGRHSGPVSVAAFSSDGRTLTGGDDGDVIVWDVERASAGEKLTGHANGITDLQLSRDGRTLYTASSDGTVFVWDVGGDRRLGRPFSAGGSGSPWIPRLDGRLIAMGQVRRCDQHRRRALSETASNLPRERLRPGGPHRLCPREPSDRRRRRGRGPGARGR